MSKVREVQTANRGLFTSMNNFELRKRENGKTTLGTGSFGAVHLASHLQSDTLYAIKIIFPTQIQGSNITTPYEQEGIEREIKVHLKSNHINIVKLYDSFQEHDTVYMVMEYVPNGNLYNYVQKKKRLEEREACKYFVQTCLALQYLHENNVFHRDIKPENLLLDAANNIKLCDFGWCAENINLRRKTFCGTYEYMAPEIVSDIAYDYTIDIWSVGVLLYELLHGYAPFKGKEYKEIAANIKQGHIKFSSSVPNDAQELIQMILQKDPSLRPSFNQIYQHSFVQRNYSMSSNSGPQKQTIKIETYHSPRISQEEQINLGKYQSPLQNHHPKGRLNLVNTNDKLSKQSMNQSNLSLSKSKQPSQYENKKKHSIVVDSRIFSDSLSQQHVKSNLSMIKSFDDIKKKINFDISTPLKDSTSTFQNQPVPTSANYSSKIEDSETSRRKQPQTNSFFCNSVQNSSSKQIFLEKKQYLAPKSALLQSQPHLFKSFKANDSKILDKKQSFTQQTKHSPVTKLNTKSRSGFNGFLQDENIYKDFSKKVTSTKTTARKEQKPLLDQYKSLPSSEDVMIDKHRDDRGSNQNIVVNMTERLGNKYPVSHQQQESKNDFDRILKMYMSLCTEQ